MTSEGELLRRYTETNSEDAFAELVRRHLNLVYSAALPEDNYSDGSAESKSVEGSESEAFQELVLIFKSKRTKNSSVRWKISCRACFQ